MARASTRRSDLLGTAQIAQASNGRCSIIAGLRGLYTTCSASGRAFTCRCAPGDNLSLHRALAVAPEGAVIACDAGGRRDVAYFGELMGLDARARGLAGLVIDGAVRDARALEQINFAVFCVGTSPLQSSKKVAGIVGKPISIRGVRIRSNDYIVADRDAIVVIPGDSWGEVRAKAVEISLREVGIRKRLEKGEHLLDILGLEPLRSE